MIYRITSIEEFNLLISGNTLEGGIPKHRLRGEDATSPRICASKSVKGALRAVGSRFIGKECVLLAINKSYITPTLSQVPDRDVTVEVWIPKLSINDVFEYRYLRIISNIGDPINQPNGGSLYDYEYVFTSSWMDP